MKYYKRKKEYPLEKDEMYMYILHSVYFGKVVKLFPAFWYLIFQTESCSSRRRFIVPFRWQRTAREAFP